MWLGLGWYVATGAPLLIIPPRSLYAFYIPMLGLAMYFGGLYSQAMCWLSDLGVPRLRIIRWAIPIVVGFSLTAVWEKHRSGLLWWNQEASGCIREMIGDVKHLNIPANGSLLLVDDPFGTDEYTPYFIFRLTTGRLDVHVHRTKMQPELAERHAGFDLVLWYRDGRLIRVTGRAAHTNAT